MYMQEAHGLDAEVILACATHVLGGSEGLLLFGDGPNTKAVAFSINDSPKELINWRYSNRIDRLIAFKPSGEILYTRCTIYWCSQTITYFNEAYSFIKRRYSSSFPHQAPCFLVNLTIPSVMLLGQEILTSSVLLATARCPTHSSLAATTL
jgi:hypothetical protein